MKVKLFVQAIAVAAAFAAPAITFAQSGAPVTRAQVRSELAQLEKAGYHPGDGDESTYPQDLQRAEARIAQSAAGANDVGGTTAGSSSFGRHWTAAPQAEIAGLKPVYFGQ